MLKIATHNSSTCEKPANFLSWLVIPFSKTQSKTIAEQYAAGCRLFDLRAKKLNSEFHAAHGLFITKRTLEDIISQINSFEDIVYATLTYEGKVKSDEDMQEFLRYIEYVKRTYTHIIWGSIALKYTDDDAIVDWKVIDNGDPKFPQTVSKYLGLDGKKWQTYIPIPWLWKKIYYNTPEFNENIYTYVDFL